MTIIRLKPNATISNADSRTGAATDWECLNDDSDSTYTSFTAAGTAGHVRLTTVALPSGAVTKSVKMIGRVRSETAGEDVLASMRVRVDGLDMDDPDVKYDLNYVQCDSFQNWSTNEIPVTWTQSTLDGLEIWYKNNRSSNGSDWSKLSIDLTYVLQPVVSVTAITPDPWVDSTNPTVSWSKTAYSSSGPFTRYWVKVFDEATYGVGFSGLDPDTDTAYYDSGNTVGSNNSQVVGPLETGDTYRAYVKVAHTINGVSLWSDWDYDEFDVSVTTSEIDTCTPLGIDATGLIQVNVERDALTAAWDFIELQRSVDGKVTWEDVRFATYVDATGDATEFDYNDYEVGNGVAAWYRARATRIVSELPITGSWVESTISDSWSSTDNWLKVPEIPAESVKVTFRVTPTFTFTARRGVFPVLGEAKPIVVSDTRSAAVAQIVLATTTAADTTVLINIFEDYDVVLLQSNTDHMWGSRFIAVGSVTVGPVLQQKAGGYADIVLSDVVEVAAPSDPSAGR